MAINQKKYLKLFQSESAPHLQRIQDCAGKLSRGEDSPQVLFEELGKSYHYLKGALGLIGLKDLREEAVRIEKILKEINAGNRQAAPEEIVEFSRVAENIRESVGKILSSLPDPA